MLPFLLIGGVAAAGAAIWYFFFRKKKEDEPPPPPEPDIEPGPLPVPESDERQTVRAIDTIVSRLAFSVGNIVRRNVVVGEETIPSQIPTDDLNIRPMQGMSEIPRGLPSALAMDDDAFYPAVAGHRIPVAEFQQQVDILEDIEEPARNIVVIIQDVSHSMKDYSRLSRAIGLNRRIIAKAQSQNAEVALLPFAGRPGAWSIARTDEERTALSASLEQLLYLRDSTDIGGALLEGADFLSDPSFTERKIVLVTDGTTPFDTLLVQQRLREIGAELHTVCIGPENNQLESISAHYDYLHDTI